MTDPVQGIDETVLELLAETYERPKPSPAFRQHLYNRLVQEVRARQQPAGFLERLRALFRTPPGPVPSWRRLVMTAVGLLVLLLVVGVTVVAIRGGWPRVSQPNPNPQPAAPAVVSATPVVQPPASPTPTAGQPGESYPPVVVATLTKEVVPPIKPSPIVEPTSVPTATPSPQPTSTPVPTATPLSSATPTQAPPRPTSTPVSARPDATSTPVPPRATVCTVGRVAGIAWVDRNGNNKRDSGDGRLGGVQVILENSSGQVTGSTSTGGDGRYEFSHVPQGTYTIRARTPAGYQSITARSWGINIQCATININFGYRPGE
ncbi:MAG: hypothetical protein D6791_14625 [Chloroflexi bacterium]|nr:MAG: hypothetical protein D6791_14625 [Chloroflexota bacterium]